MAKNRPSSLVINSEIFGETNANSFPKRSSKKNIDTSSPSSIDSITSKDIQKSQLQNSLVATPSSSTITTTTTTDSDFESEQDDIFQKSKQSKKKLNSQEKFARRVKRFNKLFKSEISHEMPMLIDSYVCAYQGDILLQGKMYITNRYLCFHSRIIAYVTKHVYRWEQIEHVRKERVAYIFPTAICIHLKHSGKKIIYASFLQRDQAFEKIISVWSKFKNNKSSFDDNNNITEDGTLKANSSLSYYSDQTSPMFDESEQVNVLQMCLEKTKKTKRRMGSVSSKSSDENKLIDTKNEKKTSMKKSNVEFNLTNNNENEPNQIQTLRSTRSINNEQKQNDTLSKNSSLINTALQSNGHDRMTSIISSHVNATTNSISNGLITQNVNRLIPFLNTIHQYISSFTHYLKIYPFKMTMFLLFILTTLFLHTFYLVKIAYRIEDRLQSLHNIWPSS